MLYINSLFIPVFLDQQPTTETPVSCESYCLGNYVDCIKDVHNPTKILCMCEEGWTGVKCDLKVHNPNDSTSLESRDVSNAKRKVTIIRDQLYRTICTRSTVPTQLHALSIHTLRVNQKKCTILAVH